MDPRIVNSKVGRQEDPEDADVLEAARRRLIESGGRASQDLGAGRIVGQILVYLYLQEHESSLDTIAEKLGISKASASIAVRQLEQFGVVAKLWKEGDRKDYYRSADNIASALQQGLLSLVRQKLALFSDDLEVAMRVLDEARSGRDGKNSEMAFLKKRLKRARQLQQRMEKVLGHPILNYLAKK